MCKELYAIHRSCGGDGTKPCVCDKSCPYYEPYFISYCGASIASCTFDGVELNGPRSSNCQNRTKDDARDKNGVIIPTGATHQCPGGEHHMKGADLPKDDPLHESAKRKRAVERKERVDRSVLPGYIIKNGRRIPYI